MAKTITNNQLTVGEIYFVRGNVTFSRVARPTTDEERAKANASRKHPIDKNYTTISICNAQVIAKNPNAPTIEERYAYECLYKSSVSDFTGNCFTAINKSRNLPVIRVKNEVTQKYDAISIPAELDKGLDVTIGMRVFKGNGNNGVSLDTIIVNEPIRYYSNTDAAMTNAAMSTLGITFSATAPQTEKEPVVEDTSALTTASTTIDTAPPAPSENPFASAPTSNPAPVENPFASATTPFASAVTENPFAVGTGNRKY